MDGLAASEFASKRFLRLADFIPEAGHDFIPAFAIEEMLTDMMSGTFGLFPLDVRAPFPVKPHIIGSFCGSRDVQPQPVGSRAVERREMPLVRRINPVAVKVHSTPDTMLNAVLVVVFRRKQIKGVSTLLAGIC